MSDPHTVLSFDVGIRNLAFCVVRQVPPGDVRDVSDVRDTSDISDVRDVSDISDVRDVSDASSDTTDLVKARLVRGAEVAALKSIDVSAYLANPTQKVTKISLHDLAHACLRALDAELKPALSGIDGVTHAIVENQPCMKNPRMKTVQIIIFTWLVRHFMGTPTRIRMFQPRQKLSIYPGPAVACTLKSAYARRKRLSVTYMRWMLQRLRPTDARALAVFERSKKKDDLADAYLQALTFLRQIA